MLIIFGGLPGTGKSTIGKKLAEKLPAVFLRIDSIEQAAKDAHAFVDKNDSDLGPEGYMIAMAIARDNLNIGLRVVADSVNPIALTRDAWRKVAIEAKKPFIEIEIICSDRTVHKNRVQTRKSSVPGLKLPSWDEVQDREYEIWQTHLLIDTATCAVDEAVEKIIDKMSQH